MELRTLEIRKFSDIYLDRRIRAASGQKTSENGRNMGAETQCSNQVTIFRRFREEPVRINT